MTRLFAFSLLALTLSLTLIDSSQAGLFRRSCCCTSAAPAATADPAPPAPPAATTAQTDRQTVRSYSYEPETNYSYRSYSRARRADNYNAGRKILGY